MLEGICEVVVRRQKEQILGKVDVHSFCVDLLANAENLKIGSAVVLPMCEALTLLDLVPVGREEDLTDNYQHLVDLHSSSAGSSRNR